MFASALALLALRSEPIRLNDASVGRREYAVEIRLEMPGNEPDVETATIAERLVRAVGGFRRTRTVVTAYGSTNSGVYKIGVSDAATIGPNGKGRNLRDLRILLPDLTVPDAPLAPGRLWTSDALARVRCRYDGLATVAGRIAHRVTILDVEEPILRGATGFVLLDAADALPLQAKIGVEFLMNDARGSAVYRLRRANVPGLGWLK